MLTREKIDKVMKYVYKSYPSLKDKEIEFYKGDQFQVKNTLGFYIVNYQERIQDNKLKLAIWDYFAKEYNIQDSDSMYSDFLEVLALLHEIGHIYYWNLCSNEKSNLEYANFKKDQPNFRYMENLYNYRQIESEKLADQFAATILKGKYKVNIWAIMNNISIQKAQEEVKFWSMS